MACNRCTYSNQCIPVAVCRILVTWTVDSGGTRICFGYKTVCPYILWAPTSSFTWMCRQNFQDSQSIIKSGENVLNSDNLVTNSAVKML